MARMWANALRFIRHSLGARAPVPMTCRQFEDFIVNYLDGSLDKDLRLEFENHIRDCRACHDYLGAYRQTVALGKRAFDDLDEIPNSVPENLVLAVLNIRYSN